MRSWFLFRLVGSGELSQFAVSRAVVFFVAGVLALNINQTVRVVFATLAPPAPWANLSGGDLRCFSCKNELFLWVVIL